MDAKIRSILNMVRGLAKKNKEQYFIHFDREEKKYRYCTSEQARKTPKHLDILWIVEKDGNFWS